MQINNAFDVVGYALTWGMIFAIFYALTYGYRYHHSFVAFQVEMGFIPEKVEQERAISCMIVLIVLTFFLAFPIARNFDRWWSLMPAMAAGTLLAAIKTRGLYKGVREMRRQQRERQKESQ